MTHHKDFFGEYKDKTGKIEKRIYSMFVRDLAIESKQVSNEQMYIDSECMAVTERKWGRVAVIDLAKSYQVVASDLITNAGRNLYEFSNYSIDWSIPYTHEDIILQNKEGNED